MSDERACAACLGRSWLLSRLGSRLEPVRSRIEPLLRLAGEELIDAVGGDQRDRLGGELRALDVAGITRSCTQAGIEAICRCEPGYPDRLRALPAPPAVLFVAGGLDRFLRLGAEMPVALVGARRASAYGLEVARSLGRSLAAAGLTVVSGMALGIDSAAHAGALEAGGPTVAVLPAGLDRPYPRSAAPLFRRLIRSGAAVSELPPGSGAWRWTFPARNRIIAGLAEMTVLIEGRYGSGSLITATRARELNRVVGAVPGRVTSALASGPNDLIARGELVVRDAVDVLDCLFEPGTRRPVPPPRALSPEMSAVLDAISDGEDTTAALTARGFDADEGLALLASLELDGLVRRGPGGRYTVVP